MKKKCFYLGATGILLLIVLFIGIIKSKPVVNDDRPQTETEEHQSTQMEIQHTEDSETESTENQFAYGMIGFDDWKEKTWAEIVALYPYTIEVYNVEQEFNSPDTDLGKWFESYNGEDFQMIPDTEHETTTVKKRREIMFYRTDEMDEQKVLKEMLTRLIDTLMVDSDIRPYTITKYELAEEQFLKQINENVWILESIEGYYSFEGTDMGTMEQLLPYETDIKDGMIRFQGQGSSSTVQYILIRNDGVYRLELASEMGFGVEY